MSKNKCDFMDLVVAMRYRQRLVLKENDLDERVVYITGMGQSISGLFVCTEDYEGDGIKNIPWDDTDLVRFYRTDNWHS